MSGSSWHAFFFEGLDTSKAPVRSEWIEAEREEDAIRTARVNLKSGQCVQLIRPRWEGGHAPVMVMPALAPESASGRIPH